MSLNTISLFSGCGGMDLGFSQAGFDIIWANDFDKYAVKTYRENFSNDIVEGDLNKVDFNTIPLADVIIGGFPCQPFSLMGKGLGFKDTRGTLFFTITEVIKNQIERNNYPKAIILENVKKLLTHDEGNTFKTIKHELEQLGYKNINYKIINTAEYGVPQTRNRIFIVCFKDENIKFEFPKEENLKLTLQDLLEKDIEEKYYISEQSKKYILSSGTKGFYSKPEIDLKIARPLLATMHKMHRAGTDNYVTTNGRLRKLTPRECARLQGFPDTFKIPVSNTQAYIQFGNAVTVTVARKIAKCVKEKIKEN